MSMAKIKLKQLVQHGDLLDRYGARIRILGQRELIKPDVLDAVDKAVEVTSHNEGNCVLNICFPYTSREEITTAIQGVVEDWTRPLPPEATDTDRKNPFREDRIADTIRSEQFSQHDNSDTAFLSPRPPPPIPQQQAPSLQSPSSSTTSLSSTTFSRAPSSDLDHDTSSVSTSTTLHNQPQSSTRPKYPSPELISASTITSHTYTASCPPVDLLVRTSGVSRLSDFLLWQCHETTEVVFLDVLWPEFDLWSFLPVLWEWQWRRRREEKGRREEESEGKVVEGVGRTNTNRVQSGQQFVKVA